MFAFSIVFILHYAQVTFSLQSSIWGFQGFLYGLQKVCLCRCGISRGYSERTRHGRLLASQTVEPHEYPWLAAINIGNQVVAGSLISDRHVITAASPLHGLSPAAMSVTLGAHDRCSVAGPGLNVSVESVTLHPEYSIATLDNDISLVKLRHVVAFSRYISPICLPIFGSREYEQLTWAVGWAQTTGTCTPHVAILPSVSGSSCMKALTDAKLMTPDKGCLGPIGSKSVICKNDTGAPIMSRWSSTSSMRLIGIVSTSSCDVTVPSVYTRVIDHAAWIYEHVRSDCQCF